MNAGSRRTLPSRLAALVVGWLACFVLFVAHDELPRSPIALPRPAAPEPAPPAAPVDDGELVVGRVIDAEGMPVLARVVLYDDDDPDAPPRVVECDPDGRFEVHVGAARRALLLAEADGYESASRVVVIPAAAPVEFRLAPAGALRVRVLLPDGTPAPAASVAVGGVSVRPPRVGATDAQGMVEFRSLPTGLYDVRASSLGLASRRVTAIDVHAGETRAVDVSLVAAVSLVGRVLGHDGAPLPNVEVAVSEDALDLAPHLVTSDADGRFRLDDLVASPYVLAARSDGFLPFGPVIVTPGEGELTFTLVRGATIRGRVSDARGNPVAGVVVTLVGGRIDTAGPSAPSMPLTGTSATQPLSPEGELGVMLGDLPPIPLGVITSTPGGGSTSVASAIGAVTDTNGTFVLVGVPPGTVQVAAHHPLHPTVTSSPRRVGGGGVLDGIELVFPPAGVVEVTVVDARGRPQAGMVVDVRTDRDDLPRNATTDERGMVRIEGVTGIVVAQALREGVAIANTRGTLDVGGRLELRIALDEVGYRLEGQVVDDRRVGIPFARVSVRAARAGAAASVVATTDELGRFVFDTLPRPPYRIEVEHASYAPRLDPSIAPDATGRLELALERGGVVTGTVIQADDDRALAGVVVELLDGGELVDEDATDARGRFRFERLATGRYEVSLRHRDFLPESRTVTLRAGREEVPTVDAGTLALRPGFTVRGVVVDALGDPVPRSRVRVLRTLGAPSTTTDTQGRYELRGLAPGAYELEASHRVAGTALARRSFRATAREVLLDVDVRLPGRLAVDEEHPDPALERGVALVVADAPSGVSVVWIAPGSMAEAAGLRVGERVVRVDGEAVAHAAHAADRLHGPVGIVCEVTLARARGERTLRVGRELYRPPPPDLLRP